MLITMLLWLNGVAFIGFGLACFFVPTMPADLIGYTLSTADADIEVRAMYGGVQTAIGIFTLLGALKVKFRQASLIEIMLVYQGLAIGRIYGLLMTTGEATGYTYGAGSFEALMAMLTIYCVVTFKNSSGLRAGS